MLDAQKSVAIKCILYDREEAWGECWMDIDDKLGPSPSMTVFLQQFDVTDPGTWAGHSKYLDSDLFTMVYFLSEVYTLRDRPTPFFENLFSNMRQDALILYVDNNAEAFSAWFDALVAGRGIHVIDGKCVVVQLASDEEKTDLGKYYRKFGYPKLTADIAYRICCKR